MKNINYLISFLLFCLILGASQTVSAQEKVDTLKKKDNLIHRDGFEHSNIVGGMSDFRKEVATLYMLPKKAQEAQVQGLLQATFVIDKEGKMIDIEIVKDLGYGTGDELVRVLTQLAKKRKWKPATKNGEPVVVRYGIPLSIRY
ncbi:energy transducer TonB [Sphingobacterium lactis]|uniref:energy transducer TonB n=1 Tax=Sphingobacterium lactis TaxID=797291 RepID=UPI003F7E8467